MNIRDLSYIVAVARLGHFGKAAESCHVSQPALSSQIKKLELELGVPIFERDKRSVRITETGQKIVALAEKALAVTEDIRVTARAAQDPFSGKFRLGFIPTIAPYLVPHFVTKSREKLAKLDIHYHEDITDRLNAALMTGEVDAAILATPPEETGLDAIRLYDEPFWVIFPSRHALKLMDNIRTKDLPVDELLLLTEGHCFRDQALDVCRLDEAPRGQTIRATSLETLVNMVASDLGITLVPALSLEGGWLAARSIQSEKLKDPQAYRRIYLTFRKSDPRKELLQKLADIICEDLPASVRRL
ncbi:MAG: hydrogen peroxide-inducible genes activator [Hellea sp.]|nr:hydrogen peroxide-inducible genes activator [Hellea sp.]